MLGEREVVRRHRASHRAFLSLFEGASPGARVVALDGVTALVCPSRPERSLVNCVVYEDAGALGRALPELAALYDGDGVQAWTVWVHPRDEAAAQACAAAGHALDASPELMWAPLDALSLDPGDVVIDEAPPWGAVGEVNDEAYGLPPGHLAVTLDAADAGLALRAVALDETGRAVSCAVVNVVGEDAHASLVATRPEARGRGLAAACMRSGLRRAAAAGATSTTLEASPAGRPVYRRMGYRELGAMGMWERRVPADRSVR
jgi:GNAT superfamily N-acetyltransferase